MLVTIEDYETGFYHPEVEAYEDESLASLLTRAGRAVTEAMDTSNPDSSTKLIVSLEER